MAEDARKQKLIADLDRARSRIAVNVHALGDDLNVLTRVKRSFARNRGVWIGGALLLGIALAKIPARTKKVVVTPKGRKADVKQSAVSAGLLFTALKFAFNVSKPWLGSWLARRVAEYADKAGQEYGPE